MYSTLGGRGEEGRKEGGRKGGRKGGGRAGGRAVEGGYLVHWADIISAFGRYHQCTGSVHGALGDYYQCTGAIAQQYMH